jgi:hypothetical protein
VKAVNTQNAKALLGNSDMVSEATHSRRTTMETLEVVFSIRFSRSYKRKLIREFVRFRQESEIRS